LHQRIDLYEWENKRLSYGKWPSSCAALTNAMIEKAKKRKGKGKKSKKENSGIKYKVNALFG
jgi:hypothetical protein